MTARRVSYLVGVTMNATLMVFNFVLAVWRWRYGRDGAETNGAIAGLNAVVLWLLIAIDARFVTQQATLESYLLEQRADTQVKEYMVKQVEAGKVGIAVTAASMPEPTGRVQ